MWLVEVFADFSKVLYVALPGETCLMMTLRAGKEWSTLAPGQESRTFNTQEDLLVSFKTSTSLSVLFAHSPLV